MSWPKQIKYKEFGTLTRVHPESDESWSCQYRRLEDGRYFTPEARHLDKDSSFLSYFASSDKLKAKGGA